MLEMDNCQVLVDEKSGTVQDSLQNSFRPLRLCLDFENE